MHSRADRPAASVILSHLTVALLLFGVLLLAGCTPGEEAPAATSKRVESYLLALASGDQAALGELAYAGDVVDVALARREAFGSEEATRLVSVKVGAAQQSGELGSLGGDAAGDLLLLPATVTTGDGRELHVDVQVWIPPGKPSSIGPARQSD